MCIGAVVVHPFFALRRKAHKMQSWLLNDLNVNVIAHRFSRFYQYRGLTLVANHLADSIFQFVELLFRLLHYSCGLGELFMWLSVDQECTCDLVSDEFG